MNISDLINRVYESTNLEKWTIDHVSKKLPSLYNKCLILEDSLLKDLAIKNMEYRKVYSKSLYDQVDSGNIEFSNKGDRDNYLKGCQIVNNLIKEIKDIENEIEIIDKCLDYLKGLNYTIKNIMDYNNQQNGV